MFKVVLYGMFKGFMVVGVVLVWCIKIMIRLVGVVVAVLMVGLVVIGLVWFVVWDRVELGS